MNQIRSAKLCFYSEDGTKEYQSSRHSLGHRFQISLEEKFTFSYAICWLQLQPNSDFYRNSLFFHLSNGKFSIVDNLTYTYLIFYR